MTTPLADQLTALGLRYVAQNLNDLIDLTTRKRWSPAQTIGTRCCGSN